MKEHNEVGACRSTPHGGDNAKQSSVHDTRKWRRTFRWQQRSDQWRLAGLRDYERRLALEVKECVPSGGNSSPEKAKRIGLSGRGVGRVTAERALPFHTFTSINTACDVVPELERKIANRWRTKLITKRNTYQRYFESKITEVDAACYRIMAYRVMLEGSRELVANKIKFYDNVRHHEEDDSAGTRRDRLGKRRAQGNLQLPSRNTIVPDASMLRLKEIRDKCPEKDKENLKKYLGRSSVKISSKQLRQKTRRNVLCERLDALDEAFLEQEDIVRRRLEAEENLRRENERYERMGPAAWEQDAARKDQKNRKKNRRQGGYWEFDRGGRRSVLPTHFVPGEGFVTRPVPPPKQSKKKDENETQEPTSSNAPTNNGLDPFHAAW